MDVHLRKSLYFARAGGEFKPGPTFIETRDGLKNIFTDRTAGKLDVTV